MEENLKTYNIKDGGKAVDATDLRNWILTKLAQENPIFKVTAETSGVTLGEFRGIVAWNVIMELSTELGLLIGELKPEDLQQEETQEIEETNEVIEESEEPKPEPKVQAKIKKEIPQPSDDDDVVVLD